MLQKPKQIRYWKVYPHSHYNGSKVSTRGVRHPPSEHLLPFHPPFSFGNSLNYSPKSLPINSVKSFKGQTLFQLSHSCS